ncbi:MAG: ABC transporter substrate-binding protein [Pseudoclavibacter sp.]
MLQTRNRKSRCLTAVAAVLGLSLALAGCSSGGSSASKSAGSSSDGVPSVSLSGVTKDDALAAKLPASIRDSGVIKIGSDTSYPPAEFETDSGKIVGSDVDLAAAIGKKLGVKTQFESASFDGILPALGNKYDIGFSSFYITNERLKSVNMVSYARGGTTLLVKKGNPEGLKATDPLTMCGHTIAVQTGSTQEEDLTGFSKKCTDAGKKKIDGMSLKTSTDAITRLRGGTADAMLAGQTILGYAARQSDGQLALVKDSYAQAPTGIAVAKDQTDFAQVLADALNALIEDGTYAKVLKAWGQSSTAIDQAEVNPQTTL